MGRCVIIMTKVKFLKFSYNPLVKLVKNAQMKLKNKI